MKIENITLEGVGLLLLSNKGRLLILEELEAKPLIQKEAGMLTFPLETVKTGESHERSLRRLLVEEVGIIETEDFTQLGWFEFKHPQCEVKILTYVAQVESEFIARPSDSDVAHKGWMSPTQLLDHHHKRLEVNPIIAAYLEGL